MIIIPAVDIKNGNCVRLMQGRASDETIYSDDPLSMALKWQSEGAERLHIIDLDGAFNGKMKNIRVILKIIKELDIPVQVGGGIRNYETVKALIDNGVHRIIIGTSAIHNREFLKSVLKMWPERITVGIDSTSGRVAVEGWGNVTAKTALVLANEAEDMGVTEIIVTDIKKDGMLKGTNLELIKEITDSVKISVIASGGVSCINDIKKLRELKIKNLTGVIIGKALYSNDIVLSDAIKVAGEFI